MSHESLGTALLLEKKLCNSFNCMLVCVRVAPMCGHVYYREGVRDRQPNMRRTKGPRGRGWTKPLQCVCVCLQNCVCASVCNFGCGWFGGIIWTESVLSWGQMSQEPLYLPALHAVSCVTTERRFSPILPDHKKHPLVWIYWATSTPPQHIWTDFDAVV